MLHVTYVIVGLSEFVKCSNYFQSVFCAVDKFCSFGFAKGRLVFRAKPNVQNAGGSRITFLNAGGQKF